MNIEEIDEWLDNEYGVSYTRLEELHDFLIEQNMKYQDKIDILQQENKQLKEEIEEYKRIEQKDLEAFNNYDSILTELEEWLNRERNDDSEYSSYERFTAFDETLDKIQRLKEKYK